MKVSAIVPIKLDNERFPGKNLVPLHGRPLCNHLLTTLTQVKSLDEIVVYCSNEEIVKHLPEGIRFFERDPALDRFEVRREQIVAGIMRDIQSDIYLLAHVTNPFLQADTIEKTVSAVRNGGYDTAITVRELQRYCWYQGNPVNFHTRDLPRTQDIHPVMVETGLYCFKREIGLRTNNVYGESIRFIGISDVEAVDIDLKEDIEYAEKIGALRRMQ